LKQNKIKIVTKIAKNLSQKDWKNIEILISTFPSNVNKLHKVNYLKNKLTNSPFGDCYVALVEGEVKKCLGFLSLTSKSFISDGNTYQSFELGDAYIDKELQGRFIFIRMIKYLISFLEQNISNAFIYGTPNNLSEGSCIRGGFRIMNYMILLKILPLRIDFLIKKNVFSFIIRMFSHIYLTIINILLKLISSKKNLNIKKIDNISNLPLNYFNNHSIEFNRTNEYLNWRFFQNPHEYDFFKINILGNYIGYVVFSQSFRNDKKALYIADFHLKKDYKNHILPIIANILVYKYDLRDYSFIATWLSKKSIYWKKFSKLLFINKKNIPFIVYYKLLPKSFLEIDNKSIHFTLADGDNV